MILYVDKEKKENDFDDESIELMYVFIKSYKVFKEIGFCLHPKFTTKEEIVNFHLKVSFKEKKDFVDFFENEKINLKIICGRNGCGKTTFLHEILEKRCFDKCIYIFKDKHNNLAASEPILVDFCNNTLKLKDKTEILIGFNALCPTHQNLRIDDLAFEKNIVDYYVKYQNVFDHVLGENDPLITHFRLKIDDQYIKKAFTTIRKHTSIDRYDDIKDLFLSDLTTAYAITFICKYKTSFLKENSFQSVDDLKLFVLSKIPITINPPPHLSHNLKTIYPLDNLNDVKKELNNCLESLNILFKPLWKVDKKTKCEIPPLYVIYEGLAKKEDDFRSMENLSSGERLEIKNIYELFYPLSRWSCSWLVFDEIDRCLHPEWCRRYLKDFLNTYKKVINYISKDNDKILNKQITLLFATHSPFLLSDVTNDYMIYLEKDENGLTKEIKNKPNLFAGNIGEMLTTNFFMDGTIGEFATDILKKVITYMNNNNKEKKGWCKNVINAVGDGLIRQLLLEKWEKTYGSN